jgi:hypothetical protein
MSNIMHLEKFARQANSCGKTLCNVSFIEINKDESV